MNEETVLTLKRLNFKQVGNFFIGKIENVYFKVCETDDNKNLLLISLSLDESTISAPVFETNSDRNISFSSEIFLSEFVFRTPSISRKIIFIVSIKNQFFAEINFC